MKKAIIVIGVLFFMMGSLAWAAGDGVLKVKADTANVRAKPNINADIVTRVNAGTILESLGKVGNWYKIEVVKDDISVIGYVHDSLVEAAEVDAAEEEAEVEEKPVRRAVPRSEQPPVAAKQSSFSDVYTNGMALHGGLSMASLTHSDADTEGQDESEYMKRKMGFLGGFSFSMGRQVGLEIGFFYMQKGVTYSGSIADENMTFSGEAKVMVDEVTAPVLLKIKFMPGSTPFIVAGGEVAYILSSKVDWSWDNPRTEQTESGTEDIKEYTSSLDYGLVFGAGYELNMSNMSLVIQGRYHLGLANIMKNDEAGDGGTNMVDDASWVKTNAIVVMLGIMF